ncbi:hypothetical protein [Pedobacter antarcticus]|uniref:hypothetical protein n=1 Tax=Pedobacter antarcticus TaxID=34086 RepID=UPI0008801562|nr:hypothetical protein [Pedobacter antarcticus]SDL77029.1 hypothetical protein SAMN04488084_102398 [Pedobacter antarcticus]
MEEVSLHIDQLNYGYGLIDKVYSLRNQLVIVEQDIIGLFNPNYPMIQDLMFLCRHNFPDSCAFLINDLEQQSLIEQGCGLSTNSCRVYTEEGAILIGILINSEKADQISNSIIQIFASLREMSI